jgi:hypothetical protein
MVYHSIANPAWVDETRKMISVDVVFDSLGATPVRFNASPDDSMPYGKEIYAALIAGEYGSIAEPTIKSQ